MAVKKAEILQDVLASIHHRLYKQLLLKLLANLTTGVIVIDFSLAFKSIVQDKLKVISC
jgi:hypothetical protein